MKLTTIWTLPELGLRERLHRTGETAWMATAHRLPRRLAYWSFIESGVRYIRPDEVVPEVTFTDLLNRF
jgi:hypothetical protein